MPGTVRAVHGTGFSAATPRNRDLIALTAFPFPPPSVKSAAMQAAPAARDQYLSEVVENAFLCREHWRLTLRLPDFPPTMPGQFVQVACRDASLIDPAEREIAWNPGTPL